MALVTEIRRQAVGAFGDVEGASMVGAHEAPHGTKPFSQRVPVSDSYTESIRWTPPRQASLRSIEHKPFRYRVYRMLQFVHYVLQCLAQAAHANYLERPCVSRIYLRVHAGKPIRAETCRVIQPT